MQVIIVNNATNKHDGFLNGLSPDTPPHTSAGIQNECSATLGVKRQQVDNTHEKCTGILLLEEYFCKDVLRKIVARCFITIIPCQHWQRIGNTFGQQVK
jgi:hypothetical protein